MGIFGRGSHNSQRKQSGNLVQKRQFKKEKKERVLKAVENKMESAEEIQHPEKFGKQITGTVVFQNGIARDWKTGEVVPEAMAQNELAKSVEINEQEAWRQRFLAETKEAAKSRDEVKHEGANLMFNFFNIVGAK